MSYCLMGLGQRILDEIGTEIGAKLNILDALSPISYNEGR